VIAVGAGRGLLVPAGLGALAACRWFSAAGAIIHRPLSRVPENTLKFGVGVMLFAFGVFWTGEGSHRMARRGFALLLFAALFLGAASSPLLSPANLPWSSHDERCSKSLAGRIDRMFFAEKRLAITVLAIVAAPGHWSICRSQPARRGAVLLFGCLILLIESVCRAARVSAS